MDIEAQRLENLRQKQRLLADLKLESSIHTTRTKHIPKNFKSDNSISKRRKLNTRTAPSRTSARIASSSIKPSYKEDSGEKYSFTTASKTQKSKSAKSNPKQNAHDDVVDSQTPNDMRTLIPVKDVEEIQAGWTDWEPVGEAPSRDQDGRFHFEDFPVFTPNKSPEEMIREGAFGGSYFRPLKSRKLGIIVENDWRELPAEWIEGLDVERYLISTTYNADANKFKVACGQSIEEWEANGWIAHEYDVRGWYQWYCRFWMGRRCDDDHRQVSRWAKCVGPTGRWRRLLLKKYVQMGVRDVFDYGDEDDEDGYGREVSPVMHQTCHHWAFEVRQGDLDSAWKETR